jgi:hypothetical protein
MKEDIKNIVNNPLMIPGIYNYCDRWCERCELTSRCANFAIRADDDPAIMDINNKKFWDKLSEIFQDTFAMIQEHATEQGIDLNERDPELEAQIEAEDEAAENNQCFKRAEKYYEEVGAWFEQHKQLFENKDKELEAIHRMAVPGCNPEADAISLNEAIEVISFYQYFISAKVYRAHIGRRDDEFAEENSFQKDSDGSAKIALIAVDRSIAAWVVLLKSLPNIEDSLLPLLVQLEKIRNELEAEFPVARAFIRSGFDEK